MRRLQHVVACIVVSFVSTVHAASTWVGEDIGNVALGGSSSENGGQFSLSGSGADIWNGSDAFHYFHQSITGDGEIIARVTSVSNSNPWSKAGVMVREAATASSKHASVFLTPQNGVAFQYRTQTAGGSGNTNIGGIAAPYWVRITRTGDTFTAYRSTNGVQWTALGSPVVIVMAATVEFGLALTSHDNTVAATATFDSVHVGSATNWPTVAIVTPPGTYTAPTSINLEASASVGAGAISSVSFYSDSILIGESFNAPYSIAIPNALIGTHTYSAFAQTVDGYSRMSHPVAITVEPLRGSGDGLQGVYFDDQYLAGFTANQIDSAVDFNWAGGAPTPIIAPTSFSVRWTGRIQPYSHAASPEGIEDHVQYNFHTVSDDGVRLWVNRQLVIDNWTYHAPTENSGSITLISGVSYDIRLEYFQGSGGSKISLAWSSDNLPKEIVPQSQLYSSGGELRIGNGDGLFATYYSDINMAGPILDAQVEPVVDHLWPDGSGPSSTFSARWTGRLQSYYSEEYTFTTRSDDGVRLWVDDQLVIDNWTNHGVTNNRATVYLDSNVTHDLRLEYFRGAGSAAIQLFWESASIAQELIPQSQLYSYGNSMYVGEGDGLTAEYYPVRDLATLPALRRVDPFINLNASSGILENSLPNNNYSIRWSGLLEAQFSETYTITARSDDGVRVWFNNQLVIDQWINQGATEYSFTANLSVGKQYPLLIEYYQYTGPATIQLLWSSPSTAKLPIPQSQLYSVEFGGGGDGDGLLGSYFNRMNLSSGNIATADSPVLVRTDPVVDFSWGVGSPAPSINTDNFSVRWIGEIEPEFTETYTFYFRSDDGVRLWVNNTLLIDRWIDTAPTEFTGTIALKAFEKVPIKIEYYEHSGGAVASMSWSSPSRPKTIVPQRRLYSNQGFSVSMPVASRTSPVFIEGLGWTKNGVSDISANGVLAEYFGVNNWSVNVPLNENEPTGINVRHQGSNVGQYGVVEWTVTDLNITTSQDDVAVRKGDSLLITSSKQGASLEITLNEPNGPLLLSQLGVPNQRIPIKFENPGVFLLHGFVDGAPAGGLKVRVLDVDWNGPTACEFGFTRTKNIKIKNGTANDVTLLENDKGHLNVALQAANLNDLTLNVTARAIGLSKIVVRLGGPSGPIISSHNVDGFELYTTARSLIQVVETFPDGSRLVESELVMDPLIFNLDVKMHAFVAGVTFEDSTLDLNISTNNPAFRLTNGQGRFTYRMIMSPGSHPKACHIIKIYQNGIQVGQEG